MLSALVQCEVLYKLLEVSETSSVEVGDFVFFLAKVLQSFGSWVFDGFCRL
jgi:hypothetical protein